MQGQMTGNSQPISHEGQGYQVPLANQRHGGALLCSTHEMAAGPSILSMKLGGRHPELGRFPGITNIELCLSNVSDFAVD